MFFKTDRRSDEMVFGDVRVIPSQNRIFVKGEEQVVQPKVMQLLEVLIASQGQTLSKQTLLTTIWPDVVVNQESLTNIVARLRRALNDDSKCPVYLETVQGKGYRWLFPLTHKAKGNRGYKLALPMAMAAVMLLGISMTILYGVQQQPKTKEQTTELQDLKITPMENGVEIAVGIKTNAENLDAQALRKEVKKLTGLDMDDPNSTIVIEQDNDTKRQRD